MNHMSITIIFFQILQKYNTNLLVYHIHKQKFICKQKALMMLMTKRIETFAV